MPEQLDGSVLDSGIVALIAGALAKPRPLGVPFHAVVRDGRRSLCVSAVHPPANGDGTLRFPDVAAKRMGTRSSRLLQVADWGCHQDHHWIAYDAGSAAPLSGYGKRLLATKSSIRLLADVASALDDAAGQGSFPWEVRPESIFVTRRGARVGDLGSARESFGGLSAPREAYVPPEVLRGEGAGDRSAAYVFGALLYYVLAGAPPRLPNGARGPEGSGPGVPLIDWRPDLPAAIDPIVAAAMSDDPRRRPRSAAEVHDMAARAIRGEAHSRGAPITDVPAPRAAARPPRPEASGPARRDRSRRADEPTSAGRLSWRDIALAIDPSWTEPPRPREEPTSPKPAESAPPAAAARPAASSRPADAPAVEPRPSPRPEPRKPESRKPEPTPHVTKAAPRAPGTTPHGSQPVTKAAPRETKPAPRETKRAPRETRPAPRETKAAPRETSSPPRKPKLAPRKPKLAPRKSKPARRETKPAPRQTPAPRPAAVVSSGADAAPAKAASRPARARKSFTGAVSKLSGAPSKLRMPLAAAARWRPPQRAVPLVAALGLGAIAGLLLGGPDDPVTAQAQPVSAAGVSITLPPGWERAEPVRPGRISARDPGAPRGELEVRSTGQFVEPAEPARPVRLGALEAWRVSRPGSVRFVVPTTAGALVIACRGPVGADSGGRALCERAASTLRLNAASALPLAAVEADDPLLVPLARLRDQRAAARRRLARAPRPHGQRMAAEALARVYERAGDRVARSPEEAAVATTLHQAAGAYGALADAAGSGRRVGWNSARDAVRRAEADLAAAIEARG